MIKGLEHQRVLVVGGTSGIGLGIACGFAKVGAKVLAVGRKTEAADQSLRQINPQSAAYKCDVTDPSAVESLMAHAAETLGGVDTLINSQGIHHKAPSQDVTDQDFDRVLQVNLHSVFRVCRSAYPLLKATQGSIINIASLSSFLGLRHAAAYTASKGAVAQVTKTLAVDWATDGIRCNAIAPGWIVTPLSEPLLADPERRDPILRRTPMGRLGEIDDIVGPVMFLASDLARFITGTVLVVDGGALASV
jgi:NAD(P)-dependent dehydrogenase (short-subunit alcohol dehydrogenase family)